MPTINFNGIDISVPDEKRFYCYKAILNFIFSIDGIEELPPTLIQSLLENQAKVLDQAVMIYLDQNLKEYISQKPKNTIQRVSFFKTKNSKIDADNNNLPLDYKKLYEDYFAENFANDLTVFAKYMLNKYPALHERLGILTINYIKNMNQLLQRIKKDYPVLQKSLLDDMDEPRLIKITSSGSDFHKKGKQVLILTFVDKNNVKRKVVYKPSPIVVDAMLFGDVAALSEFDPRFKNQQSFIEMLNSLISTSQNTETLHPLSTYMVIPRQDETGDNDLEKEYGYIQFLAQQPDQRFEYEELLRAKIESSQEPIDQLELQEMIDEEFKNFLRNCDQKQRCTFVIRDGDSNRLAKLTRYAIDCGELLAAMSLLSFSDSHAENLIIWRGRACLIDAETCFTPNINPTPEDSIAFHAVTGSMNANAKIKDTFSFLVDGRGMITVDINHPVKNILYKMVNDFDQINYGEIVPHQPDKTILLNSYQLTLNLLAQHKEVVFAWFQQEAVRKMFIRLIPRKTSDFQQELRTLSQAKFDYAEYQKICLRVINKGLGNYETEIEFFNASLAKEKTVDYFPSTYISKTLAIYPVPFFVIYTSTNKDTSILTEYFHGSIPVYYMCADGKELIDYNGNPVDIPLAVARMRDCIGHPETEKELSKLTKEAKQYFKTELKDENSEDTTLIPISLLELTFERAVKILTNATIRQQLCVVAEQQIVTMQALDKLKRDDEKAMRQLAKVLRKFADITCTKIVSAEDYIKHIKENERAYDYKTYHKQKSLHPESYHVHPDELLGYSYHRDVEENRIDFPFLYIEIKKQLSIIAHLLATFAAFGITVSYRSHVDSSTYFVRVSKFTDPDLINNNTFNEEFFRALKAVLNSVIEESDRNSNPKLK